MLAVEQVLSGESGPVVTNVATSHAVEAVAGRHGCPVYRTRVGEAYVTETMMRVGAVIGGEGNGGVIYPRVNFARDSLVAMTLALHLLARTGRRVSEVVGDLPKLSMARAQIRCPSQRIPEVLRRIARDYQPADVSQVDGVKVNVEGGWFLVRGSNTEPVLRLVAEASTAGEARGILDRVSARVNEWLAEETATRDAAAVKWGRDTGS